MVAAVANRSSKPSGEVEGAWMTWTSRDEDGD